jgi:hypothetical protein
LTISATPQIHCRNLSGPECSASVPTPIETVKSSYSQSIMPLPTEKCPLAQLAYPEKPDIQAFSTESTGTPSVFGRVLSC